MLPAPVDRMWFYFGSFNTVVESPTTGNFWGGRGRRRNVLVNRSAATNIFPLVAVSKSPTAAAAARRQTAVRVVANYTRPRTKRILYFRPFVADFRSGKSFGRATPRSEEVAVVGGVD